jgi:hypothetical protein
MMAKVEMIAKVIKFRPSLDLAEDGDLKINKWRKHENIFSVSFVCGHNELRDWHHFGERGRSKVE